jgi:tetratricopeptide (TPR) repeat protein
MRRGSLPVHKALAAAAVALAAPAASADEARREAAVIDLSEDTQDHAVVAREVARAIRRHPGFVLKDLHGVLNAGDEEEDRTNIRTAQAFHEVGAKALESGDADEAAEQLESASKLMEKSFAFLPDEEEYRDVLLRLGDARARLGDRDAALQSFEGAVDLRATPETVPLSKLGLAVFEEARARVAEKLRGAVTIESDPPHAEVYVDGRFRGVTPTTIPGLTEGRHLAAVYKAGYARATVPVDVSSTDLQEVSIELKEARRKPLYDEMVGKLAKEVAGARGEKRQGGDGVRQAGALLFSEAAVIVLSEGPSTAKRVELFLFDTASRRLLNHVEATFDLTSKNRDALVGLVDRLVAIDWAVALGGAAAGPVGPGPSRPVTKTWWFWTAIGAGVVATTAVVVLATSGEEPGSPPTTGSLLIPF